MNRVVLVGRITKDVKLSYTQSNIAVASFTIAVNRPYSNEDGNKEADFIQCVAWRKQAENMEKYVHKGDMLGIDGRISTRSYDTDDGTKYVTEVVCDSVTFLETKKEQVVTNEDTEEYEEKKVEGTTEEDLPF